MGNPAAEVCKTVNHNFNWPQSFFAPVALITTIALSALAIQGTLDPMYWGYGMAGVVGLSLLLNIVNLFQEREDLERVPEGNAHRKIQVYFQIFMCALEGLLIGLAMAGIIPVAPVAITLIAFNAYAGYYCCTCLSPLLKQRAKEDHEAMFSVKPLDSARLQAQLRQLQDPLQ